MKLRLLFLLVSATTAFGQLQVSPPWLGYVGPALEKTTNYTLGISDYAIIATADALTFTLPNPTNIVGREYMFKMKTPAISCTITSVTATILFDGRPNYVLSTSNAVVRLISDGDGWYRVGAAYSSQHYVRADIPITTTTALADVPAMGAFVGAGRHYRFTADVWVTADVTGGSKIGFNTGATAATMTYIIWSGICFDNSGPGKLTYFTPVTSLGSTMAAAGGTSHSWRIYGEMLVATTGFFQLQIAQSASNGTSTFLRGSNLLVTPVY